jgi:rubrerythrin
MQSSAQDRGRSPRHSSKELFAGKPVLQFREESSRRNFIRGAALVGVGATLVTYSSRDPRAFAQDSAGDLEILNYALTLEYLEAEFYRQGLAGDLLAGRERELVEPILAHEEAHVEAISQTVTDLGGTPVEMPMFMFPEGTFTDKAMFLMTASTFEELGVTAYHGQVPLIESPDVLKAAASIAGVESRHAAILADLMGGNPFPAPFEASMTMEEVLAAAGQFIQS